MKLFYAPAACSIGIHVLLEELGAPYETERLNLKDGEQRKPGYTAKNPKGKVPLLERDDGSVLSEYGAISRYLTAGTAFAPSGREAESRAIEALDYIVGTIHMQGFARIFRSSNFTPNAADEEWVKGKGREIITNGFSVMAGTLGEQEFLFGALSYVDCALFYVEFWGARACLDMPPALAAHLARMKARPSVQKVFSDEGLS